MNKWQKTTLGAAFNVNPKREIKRGAVTPFIPMDALPEHARQVARIERREFVGSGAKFRNRDTLLARITPCLENGKTAFVTGLVEDEVAHGSTEYIVISGKDRVSDDLFAYYFARLPSFRSHAIASMEGTSGRQRVPNEAVSRYKLELPPLVEQRAIAHILGTLDDKIELNRRMNETLEAMARAIFQSWFVDFDPVRAKANGESPDSICQRLGLTPNLLALFPDSFEDSELGEIPAGWVIESIGTLANVTGGSTPNTKESKYWDDGVHCWATPKDLSRLSSPVLLETERKVSAEGLAQIGSGLLKPGAVLLSSRAPIGYRAINEVPVAVNQGFIAMAPNSGVSNYFLLYWAEWAHDEIVSRANGSTFLEISKANFRPIPVVRPIDVLFEKFDQYVGPIYKRIVSNEQETQLLVAQRDSLLPKLLSGEVPVVAEEEAS